MENAPFVIVFEHHVTIIVNKKVVGIHALPHKTMTDELSFKCI